MFAGNDFGTDSHNAHTQPDGAYHYHGSPNAMFDSWGDTESGVIGFAAETHNVVEHAIAKRQSKGCDWILANDVSSATGTFGGDNNTIHLIDELGVEDWPRMSKADVADRLAERVAKIFESAE